MSAAPAAAVRPIERGDLDRVWALIGELADFEDLRSILTGSQERLANALFREPPDLYGRVAVVDGRIVGYALFHFTFSSFRTNRRMWLEDLYVEEAARGTGSGEALMRAFAQAALAAGCHRIDWDVLEWNPARAFYERMGAAPSAEGFLKYGMDADAMKRLLMRESTQ
jgi:GNAT superfamily N-acetyltransferase